MRLFFRLLLPVVLFCVALLCFARAQDTIPGGGVYGMFKPAGATSLIKSIQTCTVAAFSSTSPQSCTLGTTVTAANTMLVWNGVTCNSPTQSLGRCATRATLTNGTTVTFQKDNANDSVIPVVTAVEFASHVNRIWYPPNIVIATSTTSGTQVDSVPATGSNPFVMWLGESTANGTQGDNAMQVCLTYCPTCGTGGNQQVTATTSTAPITNAINVSAVVVDLDSSLVANTQDAGLSAQTAASATDSKSGMTAYDSTKTSIMWGGTSSAATSGATTTAYDVVAVAGASSTSLNYNRNSATNTSSRSHCAAAVTWATAALNSGVQRTGTPIAVSASTSGTATLGTNVNNSATATSAKAFVNWNGWNGVTNNQNITLPSISLASGASVNTVTATLNSAGTVNVGYEVVEFQ